MTDIEKNAIAVVKQEFQNHCEKQEEDFKTLTDLAMNNKDDNAKVHKEIKSVKDTVDKLSPLADLIPTIQEMADNQKVIQTGSKWVIGFLGFVALVLGIALTLFKLFTGKW